MHASYEIIKTTIMLLKDYDMLQTIKNDDEWWFVGSLIVCCRKVSGNKGIMD